jgi:hypothetical protein
MFGDDLEGVMLVVAYLQSEAHPEVSNEVGPSI